MVYKCTGQRNYTLFYIFFKFNCVDDERVYYEVLETLAIIYTFFSNSIVLKDDGRVYEVLETLD